MTSAKGHEEAEGGSQGSSDDSNEVKRDMVWSGVIELCDEA